MGILEKIKEIEFEASGAVGVGIAITAGSEPLPAQLPPTAFAAAHRPRCFAVPALQMGRTQKNKVSGCAPACCHCTTCACVPALRGCPCCSSCSAEHVQTCLNHCSLTACHPPVFTFFLCSTGH